MKAHPSITNLYVTEDGRVFQELVGSPDPNGYQLIKVTKGQNCQTVRRHQIVCETYHGEAPGMMVRHKNGKPGDDHPSNLRWGTQKQNMQDAVEHGTTTKGSKNAQAKLSEAQALDVKRRRAAGESGRALAKEYGLTEGAVCDIHKGRTWGWLK